MLFKTKEQNVRYAKIQSPYFAILAASFVALIIISNISTQVGVTLLNIPTDGAFFIFPLTYVIGDVLSEVYGFRSTRKIIALGFFALILMTIIFQIDSALPHGNSDVSAFKTITSTTPRFVIAGLSGYVFGELVNTLTIIGFKSIDGEKRLWLRLLIATVCSEFIDTLIFCTIAAPALGYNTPGKVLSYTIAGYIWKTVVEILVMPITYQVCKYIKKREPSY